jgi:flagella basal body P-ring formation protein FlgA
MIRKDCDNMSLACRCRMHEGWAQATGFGAVPSLLAIALVVLGAPLAEAGTVRMWPSAVVVDESVHLSDIAELSAFDRETERTLASLVVTHAPPPGGSRFISLEMLRSVLAENGANMAAVTLSGATQCTLTRPAVAVGRSAAPGSILTTPSRHSGAGASGSRASPPDPKDASASGSAQAGRLTLRQAVIDYFDAELARYGGRADVVFDRTSDQVLGLSGPAYQFRVRRRDGAVLGLVQLAVDVTAEGRVLQTVPLIAQVTMIRRVVVAHRPINQDAAIVASDVELVPVSFTRLDKLGLRDAAQAVGQRAKRFISAGTVLDPAMLETVPLVTRGQLVTLTSVCGSVRVVTTGKAMADGLLGDVIKVRASDNRRIELEAAVVGPGVVQIGRGLGGGRLAQLAPEAGS